MGAQYDIRHATVEGGLSWQTGFNLIRPNIKTIVLKDFIGRKTILVNGQ
jgi:L-ribulose-5-phosphate 3-epimerase